MPRHNAAPHILVVEDDATIAYILRRSLEGMGCRVTVAVDGAEAAPLGRPGAFDLAILDHFLPGLLGSEVLAAWQRAGIDFPVIVVTAMGDEEGLVAALELGAVDFVRKPFSPAELLARVRRHLRARQAVAGEP